jgi:hypothetical protein
MKTRSVVGWLWLALLFLCTPVVAQTTTTTLPAPSAEQRKAKKELEQKALALLDEIIKDAQAYRLAENRLRLRAISASLLWKYDEARARILFKETLAGITEMLETPDADNESPMHPLSSAIQLRREVVSMLAGLDARMARDFLRATRQLASRPTTTTGGTENNDDLQLEYSLATQITESDPKQALELAEESLSRGFSYELINTLNLLREKDPEAASKLAEEMVNRLRAENLTSNQEAANVAFNLLSIVFNPAADIPGKDGKKAATLLSQQAMRQLMEMNVALALSSPSYLSRLQSLEGVMPQIEKYAPARVAELRRRMARQQKAAGAEENEEAQSPEWEKYMKLMSEGTGEELLAAAANAPKEMKPHLYQAAATKFAEKGETERAREIINNNITDPATRQQLLEELERQTSLSAAEQGQMEQVRKTLANLRSNEERAMTLAGIATSLTAKGEKKLARQLLDEAQSMVSYKAKNIKQLGAQLMVAQAYIALDPARSLAMLEPIVDQLNELLAAAVTLGGFILDEEVMREDEIRLEVFTSMLGMFSGQVGLGLQTLSSYDFERTRALADRFQRDEVRMMARLLVVQSVLGDQEGAGVLAPKAVPVTSDVVPATTVIAGEGDGTP